MLVRANQGQLRKCIDMDARVSEVGMCYSCSHEWCVNGTCVVIEVSYTLVSDGNAEIHSDTMDLR